MNILIVSATEFEILPLLDYLQKHFKSKDSIRFFNNKIDIRILVTGVGSLHTSFHLATFLSKIPTDFVINLGIAGAFDQKLKIGDVLQITSDRMADIGVENATGGFTDIFEMELCQANEYPYQEGQLCIDTDASFLPKAAAITVNKVHGSKQSIKKIREKYKADIESMEGAAVFYCCKMNKINCLQIRAISNYVEPRNKDNWNIPLAIENLNKTAIDIINTLNN